MTTRPPDRPPGQRRVRYGRRRGRPLHRGQQALVDTLLPRLAVTLPATGVLDPSALFDPRPEEIWVEIGFGSGEHLAAQAAAHPAIGVIGCEVFENGVAKLLADVQRRGPPQGPLPTHDPRPLTAPLPPAGPGPGLTPLPRPVPQTRPHKP